MEYTKRSGWDAARAQSRTKVDDSARQAFMVHYSTGQELGREDTAEWVREIQRYHMETLGWADIGYNFLVDRTGRIFEGRGWDYAGAHCPDWNTLAWGVCFLGNDDPGVRDVPPEARAAIRLLYETAVARAGHGLAIKGHRDERATTCPGDELYAFVQSNLTAGLDVPTDRPRRKSRPVPGPTGTGAPTFPLGRHEYFGRGRNGTTHRHDGLRRWQRQMRRRGWRIGVDGIYGPETRGVATAFQKEKGLAVDGLIGPATFRAAWTARIT